MSAENQDESDAKIDAAADALGVDLLPWQREWLRATLNGQHVVAHRGRRAGWTTVQRVAEQILPPGVGRDGES